MRNYSELTVPVYKNEVLHFNDMLFNYKLVYYLNLTENKILYDERKKRFIYLKDASREQAGLFNRSHFKWQRPDLYGGDQIQFQQDLKNGQSYLRSLMYFNKMEMRRLSRALGNNANRYIYPIMDDYLRQYQVDAIRTERL